MSPNLSKRALDLLHRIYEGHFESAFATGPIRKSLQELIDAKLVTTGGRVVKIARYYVPAKGFKSFTLDKMPAKPKWMTPKVPPPPQYSYASDGRTSPREPT